MYFRKYKLDTPSNDNELYTLLFCLSRKYCNDNKELRDKLQSKQNNNLNIADAKNVNNSNKIDSKTKYF